MAIRWRVPEAAQEIAFATPEGITLQPLGKAQGYDLGKQTAAFLAREQIAYADAKGMTLYTYDKDEPGKSNCVDACTTEWKPVLADAGVAPGLAVAPVDPGHTHRVRAQMPSLKHRRPVLF